MNTELSRQERDEILQKVYPELAAEKKQQAEELGLTEEHQDEVYTLATSIAKGNYQREDGIKFLQSLSSLLKTPAGDTLRSVLQEMSTSQ